MMQPAPLAVFAQLSLLTQTGDVIDVQARDTVITVTLPRLESGRSLLGPCSGRSRRQQALAHLHAGLQVADLTLEFKAGRRVVARLRPQSRPTLLSRLLGLGAVEVQPLMLLLVLLRR